MKNLGLFAKRWSVGGVAVLTLVMSLQARAEMASARVVSIKKGSADYSSGGGTWTTLKGVKTVQAGDTIRTDDAGTVALHLGGDAGSVTLAPNTTLVIDKLNSDMTGADRVTETQLNLKAGRIVGDTGKLAAASKYEVKTPNAVAGVRGTSRFEISQNNCVVVARGTVVVVCVKSDNTTLTRVVNGGERFCCEEGSVVPASQPDLARVDQGARQVPTPAAGGQIAQTFGGIKSPSDNYIDPPLLMPRATYFEIALGQLIGNDTSILRSPDAPKLIAELSKKIDPRNPLSEEFINSEEFQEIIAPLSPVSP